MLHVLQRPLCFGPGQIVTNRLMIGYLSLGLIILIAPDNPFAMSMPTRAEDTQPGQGHTAAVLKNKPVQSKVY